MGRSTLRRGRAPAMLALGLLAVAAPAADDLPFCGVWRTLPASEKVEFIKKQAQVFIGRDAPEYWQDYGECIAEDVPQWISGADGACAPPGGNDFDAGRMIGAAVAASLMRCRVMAGPDGRRAP